MLVSEKCLNPRPPKYLGWQRLSQARGVKYRFEFFDGLHQKFFSILSISSHKLFGMRKEDLVYSGVANAIDFTSVALPIQDKDLLFQLLTLDCRVSLR